ncbi:hypothetical protein AAHE18_15G058100 [Arachis hypogaea]
MMEEVAGAFGSSASFALRLGQTVFSSASLLFMCFGVDFYSYTAFCYLVTVMGLVIPWSVTLLVVDAYSVFIKDLQIQQRIVMIIFLGDMVFLFVFLIYYAGFSVSLAGCSMLYSECRGSSA